MTKTLGCLWLLLTLGEFHLGMSQEQKKDSLQEPLPKLEIPELTIVGKKAIALPFAKKGEIYDVNVFLPPAPDSSLLGNRRVPRLAVGALPRNEERLMPWRISAEGALGSFAFGNAHGYIDYTGNSWGIVADGGYSRTDGHVPNASATSMKAEVSANSLVKTDNEILQSFLLSVGTLFNRSTYGMFGLQNSTLERTSKNVVLNASAGSVQRHGSVFDVVLDANMLSVTDNGFPSDSQVSAVSTTLRSSFSTDLGRVRFGSELVYKGTSLDYHKPTQTPTLLSLSADTRWRFSDQWFIQIGGSFANATDSYGGSKSLLAPTALLRWEIGQDREITFWYQPEVRLATYDELIRRNPFLVREFVLRPERTPINFGSSFWFKSGLFSIEVSGSYDQSSNKNVTLADSGTLVIDYVDANRLALDVNGSFTPHQNARIKFSGTIQKVQGENGNAQLPMNPVMLLSGRGEVDLKIPVTIWSGLDYRSPQNVDLAGARILNDVFLLGGGISTHGIPRTVLSFGITNILNTAYQWWESYPAPGRQLIVEAKISLR